MYSFAPALLFLAIAASAAPVYQQMYGGPGPNTSTDSLFVAAGNTDYESFGFEVSFNGTTDARINALVAPQDFNFSVASVNTPTWVKNRIYNFTQSYSGDLTRLVNISVTDPVANVTYTIPQYQATYGNVRALIVRMVAPDPDRIGSPASPSAGSLSFSNWLLQGQTPLGMPSNLTISTTNTPADDIRLINYFKISGIDFRQAWTLSGSFQMDWSGSTFGNPGNPLPRPNDLAFQIKAYQLDLTETPEPGTFFLLGAALVGLACWRRRMQPRAIPQKAQTRWQAQTR